MAKEKKVLTEEEKAAKKKHFKEELQGYVVALFFILAFLLMFAIYGMRSSLFGG